MKRCRIAPYMSAPLCWIIPQPLQITSKRPRRHDQRNEVNVWVCECCALWIENGDDSSCRDYYNHTHPRWDSAITYLTGAEHRVGYFDMICDACGTIQHNGADMYGAIRPVKVPTD